MLLVLVAGVENVGAQMENHTKSEITLMHAKVWHALTDYRVLVTRRQDPGAIEKSHAKKVRTRSQF